MSIVLPEFEYVDRATETIRYLAVSYTHLTLPTRS